MDDLTFTVEKGNGSGQKLPDGCSTAEPKLRLKIDGGEIITWAAVLEDADGKLKGFADASPSLYEKI